LLPDCSVAARFLYCGARIIPRREIRCRPGPCRRHGGPDILALLAADRSETMVPATGKTRRVMWA
jgi:hypothetical protein